MTSQMPSPSPSPNDNDEAMSPSNSPDNDEAISPGSSPDNFPDDNDDERRDETIAAIVALVTLGLVFFVGVTRNRSAIANAPIRIPGLTATEPGAETDQNVAEDDVLENGGWRFPFSGERADAEDGITDGYQSETGGSGDRYGQVGLGGDRASLDTPSMFDTILGNSLGLGEGEAVGEGLAEGEVAVGEESAGEESAGEDTAGEDVLGEGTDDNSPVSDAEASDDDVAATAPGDSTSQSDSVDPGELAAEEPSDSPPEETTAAEANADDGESATDIAVDNPSELAAEVPAETFTDVSPQYWASPFIEGLRQQEIATGFADGEFEPDSRISRAQFASQLARAFSQAERLPLINYNDLSPDHPQYEAITQVTKSGFMKGYDVGDFRPDNQVSRMEVLLTLVAGLDLTSSADAATILNNTYQDVEEIPEWAVPVMAIATDLGLVVSEQNPEIFDPKKPATRAEASAMLYQALVYVGDAPAIESEYIVRP